MFTALNTTTVPELWEQKEQYFVLDMVDLRNLQDVDSAGVAFLVQWAKALKGRRLTLKNTPPRLFKLIETFRVTELFDIV